MPPRRGARRGTATRRGRDAGRNAGERVEDRASQHGGGVDMRQERVVPPPENQNPPNLTMEDVLAAIAAQNLHDQANRTNHIPRAAETARDFRRADPPKFDGMASDPFVADHWLSEVRDVFEILDIGEDHMRVKLIAGQLIGEAKEWWKSVKAERKDARRHMRAARGIEEPDVEDMTWDEFEERFEDQYFPRSYRTQLRMEFERIEQGAMSVTEYVNRFQSLSRFASELVSSEERKCERFVLGLRPSIRRIVLGNKRDRFSDLVEIARDLERDDEMAKGARRMEPRQPYPITSVTPGSSSEGRKRSRDSMQSASHHSSSRASTHSGTGGSQVRSTVICHRCNQPGHVRNQCPLRPALPPPVRTPGACFGCGEFGHTVRFCPHKGSGRDDSGTVQQPQQEQELGWQQEGSRDRPHYHQTTVVRGAQGERGGSSTIQPPLTRGRVYNIMSTIPSTAAGSSQAPDTSTVRGTLSFLSFL